MERQFISAEFDNVLLVSPLIDSYGDLSFILDGKMDFFFREDYFPEALIPSGELSIKNIRLRQESGQLSLAGSLDILASGGIVDIRNLRANIAGGGQARGFAKIDLTRGGQAAGILDFQMATAQNMQIMARNRFRMSSIMNPAFDFQSLARLIYGEQEVLRADASGKIDESLSLNNILLTSQYGTGRFAGSLDFDGNYSLRGNFRLNKNLDDTTSLRGNLRVSVEGSDFVRLPEIRVNSSNLRILKPQNSLSLPSINIDNSGDTINFSATARDFRLLGSVKTEGGFSYSADLRVGQSQARQILAFFTGLDFDNCRLNFSGNIYGDLSALNFRGNAGFNNAQIGNITSNLRGQIAQNQRNLVINSLRWTPANPKFAQNSLSLRGNLRYSPANSWRLNLGGSNLLLNASISDDFSRINSGELQINGFALDFFNMFLQGENGSRADNMLRAGKVNARLNINGTFDEIRTNGRVHIEKAKIQDLEGICALISFSSVGSDINIPGMAIRKNNIPIIRSRNFTMTNGIIAGEMAIDRLDLQDILPFFDIDYAQGYVSARINIDGEKVVARVMADSIGYDRVWARNLRAEVIATNDSIFLSRFDTDILGLKTTAHFKAAHHNFRITDGEYSLNIIGDFFGVAGKFVESPVGGIGKGSLDVSGYIRDGDLEINRGRFLIPQGKLAVIPFARDTLQNVFADINIIDDNRVCIMLNAQLNRRNLVIRNDFNAGDLTPFHLLNLDIGVLRVWTERGGIPVFLPGFMENRPGNVGYIETAAKDDIPTFTIASHPENFVTLAGTLLVRRADITFPLLDDVEWEVDLDVFPYLYFDLDVRPGDRTVNYFFQIGREGRRRGFRVIEAVIDPSGTVGIRGNDTYGNFRITGGLRSFSGYIFFGRMFDRNLEIGLDFQPERSSGDFGYDNLPIIWGSAQTYSDTDRMERVTVRLTTRDPETGLLLERGRFTELVIVPEGDWGAAGRRSQDEFAASFYEDFGRSVAERPEALAAGIGDAYLTSFFLNYWGRQIARRVGLDMIRFESSVIGNTVNFLTERQLDEDLQRGWEWFMLNNASFIAGRHIHNDIFLRYQTRFFSRDLEVIPEHRFGIEYQPFPFLLLDFNYGFFRERISDDLIINPSVGAQFRMPIRRRHRIIDDEY